CVDKCRDRRYREHRPHQGASMRIALAQIAPKLGALDENLERHREIVKEAVKDGASLVVFPETSLTGYFLEDLAYQVSLSRDDDRLRFLAPAQDVTVVAGFVEETRGHKFYLSAAVMHRQQILHV